MTQAPLDTTSTTALTPVVEALTAHDDVIAWLKRVHGDPQSAHARVGESVLAPLLAAGATGVFGPGGAELVPAQPMLVVVDDDAKAERVAEAIGWYLGDDCAAAYLPRGVPYGGGIAPAPARIGARACARHVAASGGVVVAPIAALVENVPQADARPAPIRLRTGQVIERDELVRQLVDAGYERLEQAEQKGQIAVRGDIVDVYGTTAKNPVRIEFFDDEIEGMRNFSSYTQRSLGPIDHLLIFPAAEVTGLGSQGAWWSSHSEGDPVLEAVDGVVESAAVAFDGLTPMTWEAASVQRELEELVVELGSGHHAEAGYADEGELLQLLSGAVALDPLIANQKFTFEGQPPVFGAVGFAEAEAELKGLPGRGLRTIVTFPHAGHRGRTYQQLKRVHTEMLEEHPALGSEPGVWLAVSMCATGFVSPQLGLAVVPSGRLFRTKVNAGQQGGRVGQSMSAFTSLRAGDFVVHEDHGVGRFAGFETKTVADVTRDYLYIEFAGADRLYVPHEQMGKVTRYVGADGNAPALSKLGGKKWSNLKNRARQAVRELAGELIALYAKRSRAVGHGFPEDDELMERFELTFPYQETEDQLTAIAAVKEDMERPQPMDRLICGDVGFGKTEVAMRAAVKAVTGGRQVMVLVPTTVLANQHLVSFRERFAELPVTVDMVSRFRSPKQVKETLAEFQAGKVDILIGTHRLLSRDVVPQELGLVIVDEEQRFGVAQKEWLRQLRLEVDVLALSATPIPRTLHMSLAGMRDITVIETAPHGRRPIHTHVGEYDEQLIRHAIERELERDGQVFYLHNRVETIDEAAAKIRQIVPSARVGVGHGQMTERQLESVMLGFLRNDFDVLVATTIIESGLDIPTANTLLVERADMLGLSQLYQIRGRVGRSSRSAHAYLFYPSARELTEESRARLTTLSDFTDLGSGSKIAMRDLELRGAGNLLGGEQSGHVAAVGFELYVDMLAQAVSELSGEQLVPERPRMIDTRMHAYVPADYVASEAIKIDLHRRIAMARDEQQLLDLVPELEDRFGDVPDPVHNLLTLAKLRLLMARVGAERLAVGPGRVVAAPITLSTNQVAYLKPSEPYALYSPTSRELQVRVAEPAAAPQRALDLLRNLATVLGG